MQTKYFIVFLLGVAIIVQNCNCGSGTSVEPLGPNVDSLRIADSIKQELIKDSLLNDSILKAQNIKVQSNDLKPEVQEKVVKVIEERTEASLLKDKTPEQIYKLYEAFVNKYDKTNKSHQVELSKWTSDPLFSALKKDDNWVEKIEDLEAQLLAKK